MKRTLIAGAAFAVALSACPVSAQELTGTLKNIKETGAITIGYRDSSIPFSYLDDNQKPIGYAIDICYKIVDAVKKELKLDKLEVKLNPVTSATRIPLMANGTVDLECGSTTNNAERQKQVSFTNTHFLTASRFVSKKANNIKSIDDLKGKSVVSTSGTTNIKQLNEANAARSLGINIIRGKRISKYFETDIEAGIIVDGEKVTADCVLACDGVNSKARGFVIGSEGRAHPTGYATFRAWFDGSHLKDDPQANWLTEGERDKSIAFIGPDVHCIFGTGKRCKEVVWVLTHLVSHS